jgi:hypothetical protein
MWAWFDVSFAARGFLIMTVMGLGQAWGEPVFDSGMIGAAFIAGGLAALIAGLAAPPVRWTKRRLAGRSAPSGSVAGPANEV